MCLACGFDGVAIQSDRRETLWSCPRCASDLYARPPRSYAELEGFEEAPAQRPRARALEFSAIRRACRDDSAEPPARLTALMVFLGSLLGATMGVSLLLVMAALDVL